MAKRQSFADKASKKKHTTTCQSCGGMVTYTLFVLPTVVAEGGIKYKKKMVPVCKCNHKEYYG